MDENFFLFIAAPILARHANPTGRGAEEHFRYFFGVSALVASTAWDLLRVHNLVPDAAEPVHLLWACFFLCHYTKETIIELILGRTMKTVRLHMWPIIAALGELASVVVSIGCRRRHHSFSCRFVCPSNVTLRHTHSFLVSASYCSTLQIKLEDRCSEDWMFNAALYVDCVDFMIEEPNACDPWWYSHKSNGPGLRYELATSIQTGLICWASGPWRAGLWNEKTLFMERLYHELEIGEQVHADRGYPVGPNDEGEVLFITPNTQGLDGEARIAHGQLHARHEGVNVKMKKFAVSENRFRHDLEMHGECFYAVATLVQLRMMVETTPYHVEYIE